jgi:hypothetical protein
MRYILHCFLLIAVLALVNCKGKKKPSPSGDDPVEITDFIGFFPDKSVPFYINDTMLAKREADSVVISNTIFSQFIPDSLLTRVFGKGTKAKIYPSGKVKAVGGETYLFAKAMAGDKKAAFVFAFDKKEQLMDGMTLLRVDQSPLTQQSANMDKGNSLNITTTRKNADGSFSEGKDVYGLNLESKKFELIMTDAIEDKPTELLNPIDTVSRKHKYAADYGTGKLNLVSIRDGRKKDRLSFFFHFEKNDGACTGELKGEAILRSANVAEYREGGDPCVLRFSFTTSSVSVKEIEGCGAHRGLRCSFEGTYPRKKEAKPKPAKKK